MQYDPIKRSLGKVFNRTPFLRIVFYKLLDILLLRTWHVRKEIRKWAGKNRGLRRVMDAGSGFGQYSYYMASAHPDWHVTGLDVKDEQIADCNAFFSKIGRTNVHFEVADLTRYIAAEPVDFILSVDVMEHIEEDVQVFRNFHTSLNQGGMLLISTPSDQGGSGTHEHEHDEVHGFIDEHVRDGYSFTDIENKLKMAGFSKIECRYSYGTPGKISWRLSMKYPIQMLNVSKIFFILLPFYYLLTFPFFLLLNYADVVLKHSSGTGILVKAWK